MALSNELISQFAKLAVGDKNIRSESTVMATVVDYADSTYVRIDGAEMLTPVASTTDAIEGDRVTVLIKDHTATIIGNITSPSARLEHVQQVESQVGTVIADNVIVKEKLTATEAEIVTLKADNVTINVKLTANEASIKDLEADNVTVNEKLTAAVADIGLLEADNATINGKLTAAEADIGKLKTEKLSATEADIKYANIDFANIGEAAVKKIFSDSGIIKDLVMKDGAITGELTAVTINGDLINAETLKADRLVVKGKDGLYYKLNVTGSTVETEQTNENSLNGSVITAKSITATKINVSDLVAFGATIGGFKIGETSIYSDVKSSVDNTTRGIYMDKTGQIAIGDSNNYFKYYKDPDTGEWKLKMAASEFEFALSNGESIDDAIAKTIVLTEEEFYQSDSPTALTGGSWSKTQPTWTNGKYIWRRTKNTYNKKDEDGNPVFDYTPSETGVCITGATGAKGDKGDTGATGAAGKDGQMLYATCSTAASTTAKVATLSTGSISSLTAGVSVTVKFTYANTAYAPTLNVASKGAKTIKVNNITPSSSNPYYWKAGTVITFVYDGSYWIAVDTAVTKMDLTSSGLVIGNYTGDTLNNNVLIGASDLSIRNGSKTLAKFASKTIELGNYEEDAVITMCGGKGNISLREYGTDEECLRIYGAGQIQMCGEDSAAMYALQDVNQRGSIAIGSTVDVNGNFLYPHASMTTVGTVDSVTNTSYIRVTPANITLGSDDTLLIYVYNYMDVYCSYFRVYGTNNFYLTSTDLTIKVDTEITKDLTVGGTLGVTGATTLSSTLKVTGAVTLTKALTVANGGTGATTAAAARANLATWYYDISTNSNYPGLARPNGTSTGWVRTTQSGLIPYASGGSSSSLGTSSWPFKNGYFENLYVDSTKMHYKAGDSITDTWWVNGFVTFSSTKIYFIIPLSKPVIGSPTVTVTSVDGFIVRQHGYAFGSSSSTNVKPSTYSATLVYDGNGIKICATMSDTTNVLNNYPCAISANIKITFS